MVDYLNRIYTGVNNHLKKLPSNWKSSTADAFALPFIGALVYRRDFKSALQVGSAFGAAKTFSYMASPYLKDSAKGRLADGFLRGFALRSILDLNLKKACFGGFVYALSEGMLMSIEMIAAETLTPIFEAGTKAFASKSAASLNLEEGAEKAGYAFFAKLISVYTKDCASYLFKQETFLKVIESVAGDALEALISTKNFKEVVRETFFSSVSFTAKEAYSATKEYMGSSFKSL